MRKGRSWGPKTEPIGTPSSYYLRYLKNGKCTFESAGDDLQVALQEQKARRVSHNTPAPITVITQGKTLRTEVQHFDAIEMGDGSRSHLLCRRYENRKIRLKAGERYQHIMFGSQQGARFPILPIISVQDGSPKIAGRSRD